MQKKSDITKELEKRLPTVIYREPNFDTMRPACLVDVMANIRKIKTKPREIKTFGEFVHIFLNFVKHSANGSSRVDLVFDSYLEKTIKDSERKRRARTPAVELNKVERETPLPVQMEKFWPSSKNKASLETLIHHDAILYPWNGNIDVFVSAFDLIHGKSLQAFKISNELVVTTPDLDVKIEEADLRLVLHAYHATRHGFKRVIIQSQDTDVLILFLYNWNSLASFGLKEAWITAGVGDTSRYIPIHILADILGEKLCQVLPAVHVLTGCDYTSKFGTKAAALKATPELFLKDFVTLKSNIENQITQAEQYLIQVKKQGSCCKNFDQLRSYIYHHSKSSDLPPTSHETRFHIFRALYAAHIMKTGITASEDHYDPRLYGYGEEDDLLIPKRGRNPIPEDFTVTCNCSKCSTDRCQCRTKHLPCCSFCKCRSNVSNDKCANPFA